MQRGIETRLTSGVPKEDFMGSHLDGQGRWIDALTNCRDALKQLLKCFDDEGNLREQFQDQLSIALEAADAAIEAEDKYRR
jgi:hypothetical protein